METEIESHKVSDEAVWNGIQSLFDNYLKINSLDTVIVGYTPDSREAAAWIGLALKSRNIEYQSLHMFPLRDAGFKERLHKLLPAEPPDKGRLVLMFFERDTMSHNEIVKDALSDYDPSQYFVVRSINSDRHLFATGLSLTPEILTGLNTTLLERCLDAKNLRITTNAGTDLRISLDRKYRWISNKGTVEDGKFLIIPCGEVATFPAEISGVLVADFAINVNTMIDIDARLNRNPVTVQIENSEMKSFKCENKEMTAYLSRCFDRQNAKRVGELGLGTNSSVQNPIFENSHLNERCPGVHIGFGQHNQEIELAGYFCDIHIDLIAKGGLLWVDESPEPIDLSHLKESSNKHPSLVLCEDVFSCDSLEGDCCGISKSI